MATEYAFDRGDARPIAYNHEAYSKDWLDKRFPDKEALGCSLSCVEKAMGTDRWELFRGACPCGRGEVSVDHCTPDHPYPTDNRWFEPYLHCSACSREYVVLLQGKDLALVRHDFLEERRALAKTIETKKRDLMDAPHVRELRQRLTSLLREQPSVAATFRLLRQNNLTMHGTLPTFRRHWGGAEAWAEEGFRPGSLISVMKMLKVKSTPTLELLDELRELERELRQPYPVAFQVADMSQWAV